MASNLYIIDNTGVGKSLLCNCLIGKWEFDSKSQADSCTREVSFVEVWIPTLSKSAQTGEQKSALPFRIFNIPGLLEADPIRVQQNVKLLQSALDQKEPSIVLYILTTEGGRIRDNDYAAFKALKEAYEIQKHSFLFIVNKSTKRDNQNQIRDYIQKMMGTYEVGFLPQVEMDDNEIQQEIVALSNLFRPQIMDMIRPLISLTLTKHQELKLDVDHIRDLKEESRQNKIKFEAEKQKLESERNFLESEHAKQTSELAITKQQLTYALEQAQQTRNCQGIERGGEFSFGPLRIRW